MSITITIGRSDHRATRLEGKSGMAVCMGPMAEEIRRSDPPVVSLRCSTPAQIAWNLAALMGAVRHVAPEAYELAHELMPLCNFAEPRLHNRLPPETRL